MLERSRNTTSVMLTQSIESFSPIVSTPSWIMTFLICRLFMCSPDFTLDFISIVSVPNFRIDLAPPLTNSLNAHTFHYII